MTKLNRIKEAIKDWGDGKLSSGGCCFAINDILYWKPPTREEKKQMIEWGEKEMKELRKKGVIK
jgi:hypothetical protein